MDQTESSPSSAVLTQLMQIIEERKTASPDTSYVASLFQKGLNKILEKVGEESIELIIAAKELDKLNTTTQRDDVIYEAADLWFHMLILFSQLGISEEEILSELGRRFGTSGIEEKASRGK